jgi:hypothetical protein
LNETSVLLHADHSESAAVKSIWFSRLTTGPNYSENIRRFKQGSLTAAHQKEKKNEVQFYGTCHTVPLLPYGGRTVLTTRKISQSALTLSSPAVTIRTTRFNIQQFYVLPTQRVYVFCVDLRTNSDYFPIQH